MFKETFREAVPRTFRLSKDDFDLHGYSADCPGCSALLKGGTWRAKHSAACRDRMVRNLEDDERIKQAKTRREEYAKNVLDTDAEREEGKAKRRRHDEEGNEEIIFP